MQRHFSNRGEALAEVVAAKMIARRMRSQSVFANRRGSNVTPGRWQARVPEAIRPIGSLKKSEPKDNGISGVGPLGL